MTSPLVRRTRLLSFLMLLLSVTPLASVYTLLTALWQQQEYNAAAMVTSTTTPITTTSTIISTNDLRPLAAETSGIIENVTNTTILKSLASLEELVWNVVFHNAPSSRSSSSSSSIASSHPYQVYHQYLQQHLLFLESSMNVDHSQHQQHQQQHQQQQQQQQQILVRQWIIQNQLPVLFSIIIPLGISLLVFILLLYYSYCVGQQSQLQNYPGRRRRQQQQRQGGEEEWLSSMDKAQLKQKVIQSLVGYRMKLMFSDRIITKLVVNKDKERDNKSHGANHQRFQIHTKVGINHNDDDDDDDKHYLKDNMIDTDDNDGEPIGKGWWIPLAGTPLESKKENRQNQSSNKEHTVKNETSLVVSTSTSKPTTSAATTQELGRELNQSLHQPNHHHQPQQQRKIRRPVTEPCAICLMHYSCGDTLVWSSNSNCVHCFHEQCILIWLLKQQNKEILSCPCCRQVFVDNHSRKWK